MKDTIQKIEGEFFNNIDRLESELGERDQYAKQVEEEYYEMKQFHKGEILDFIKVNDELRTYIEELNRDIENKRSTIEQLRINHDELITHLEAACR